MNHQTKYDKYKNLDNIYDTENYNKKQTMTGFKIIYFQLNINV